MQSPPDHFESAKLQIERGRQHIQDAETRIRAFFEARPHARVIEIDPQTGEEVHKIRLTSPLPRELRGIVKDVCSNLRDALDHAVYASAVALVGGDPPNTGFPFARDAAGVLGELDSRRLRGNPTEIRPLLASFDPHEAGNDLLWGLNRIRNPNTHRMLVPVGAAGMMMQTSITSGSITSGSLGYSRWDPATNEVEYLRLGPGSYLNYEVQVSFNVTFGDVDILRGKETIGTLYAIASEVQRVVLAIEAETARLVGERSP